MADQSTGLAGPRLERDAAYKSAYRRLLTSPQGSFAVIVLAVLALLSVTAPYLSLPDPFQSNPSMRLRPPLTGGHVLGTDELGRDILARIVWGTRLSLGVGLGAMLASFAVGATLGILAGTGANWLDQVVMRLLDVLMSFPYVLLSIAIVAVIGPGLFNTVIAVAAIGVPTYARVVRSACLTLREEEFISAAVALGVSPARLVLRHYLPNLLSVLIVTMTLDVGAKITAAAGLSFIGLGIQPPAADWGAMLASGRSYFLLTPHVVVFPGLAILLTVMAFNLLGDKLQELVDPKFMRRNG
jgi:peptide/nickel transport system permease protein